MNLKKLSPAVKNRVEMLYDIYHVTLFNMAMSYLHDEQLAEDCVHDAIIRLAHNMEKIGQFGSPKANSYIYRTVKTTAIDIIRKREKESPSEIAAELYEKAMASDEDINAIKGEYGFGDELDDVIGSLDSIDIEILCMRYGDDLKYSEIAEKIGVSKDFVAKRVQRACTKMKLILLEKEDKREE